ncbi:MAG: FAD-binding protein [Streptomyces sp.]|nr:FAD-binding protein [Streptomyces sp.]
MRSMNHENGTGELVGFQTAFDLRPATVLTPATAEDVIAAVRHAADTGQRVAVEATGHGRQGPVTGGVLLSTRRMDGITVDPVVLAPCTLGRTVNFAFGGGDRREGLYDAGTRKRLAEVKSTYDPANLFGDGDDVSA